MPTDRSLVTLLRSLQTPSELQDTQRLFATTALLLTTLANPLNLTLLTQQLLCAPAIWTRPDGLATCFRFLGLFEAAALRIVRYENQLALDKAAGRSSMNTATQVLGGDLSRQDWIKAALRGADDRSPRWRHLLLITGLLRGYENEEAGELPGSLQKTLQQALIQATHLALDEARAGHDIAAHTITLSMNYALSSSSQLRHLPIDYDRLLPVLVGTTFFSTEGFRSAYFFESLDADLEHVGPNKFQWPDKSPSFRRMSSMTHQPILQSIGRLAHLITHCAQHVRNPWLIQTLTEDLLEFTSTLSSQWRRIKLSEVDASEESSYFDDMTLTKTLPVLWRLLRSALFAVVIVLQGIMARALNDRALATDDVAPRLASQSLQILQNTYFLTVRHGPSSFTMHTFVALSAIDILAAYPHHATAFLESIRPTHGASGIPSHPLDRNLDLYFLNTAEHFALILEPQANEQLLISAAIPYLSAGSDSRLLEVFEAAHSVVLSVLSAPSSAISVEGLALKYIALYIDALFTVFPQNLSARQFRLAFKTLVRVTTPPSTLAATHPELIETLLELLHHRLTTSPENTNHSITNEGLTLTLALVDALPLLPPQILDMWLPIVAELIRTGRLDTKSRQECRHHFWDVLSNGEMDGERSLVAVRWWGTREGAAWVRDAQTALHAAAAAPEHVMSGAASGLVGQSKL